MYLEADRTYTLQHTRISTLTGLPYKPTYPLNPSEGSQRNSFCLVSPVLHEITRFSLSKGSSKLGVKLNLRSMPFRKPPLATATDFFERCRKAYLKSSSQNDAIIFFIHDFTLSGKKTRSKESNRTWNFTIRKAEHRRSRVTLLRLLKYHHLVALIGSKARTNLNGAQMNPWNWGSSK